MFILKEGLVVLVLDEMYDSSEKGIFSEGVGTLWVQNYISTGAINAIEDVFIAVNRTPERALDPENGIEADYSCDAVSITAGGDIEILGNVFIGDFYEDFQVGPIRSGGIIIAEALNAGIVHCTEDFVAQTANVEELNCAGNVEVEDYLYCECGAFVLGDITTKCLVSEAHPVFCGGKFTGEFKGNRAMLHEHFTDWGNLKKYL